MNSNKDWYEHRNELNPGDVFKTYDDCVIRLDRRVPGDGTDWYADVWMNGWTNIPGYEKGHWSSEDAIVSPGDLTEKLPNDFAG